MASQAAATATAVTVTAAVKKPGPPVPPRPQHTVMSTAVNLLKAQRESMTNRLAGTPSTAATTTATTTTTTSSNGKITVAATSASAEHPVLHKKPMMTPPMMSGAGGKTATTGTGGRTIIYKSPSMNLQKKLEERDKRSSLSSSGVNYSASFKTSGQTGPSRPPLKLRKAPDVPVAKPRLLPNEDVELRTTNNIVIVQSSNGGVNLNRHNSLIAPKTSVSSLKDSRFSLGRADFNKQGKIHLDQLQPGQPLPKPRKIVKMPVATMDVDDGRSTQSSTHTHTSSGISLFRRSKTTLDNLVSRSSVTTISTGSGSGSGSGGGGGGGNSNGNGGSTNGGGFLSGKTIEIKNNLKNVAERLFSEIIVNQQHKQSQQHHHHHHNHQQQHFAEPHTLMITKHERAVQHQALLEQELAQERQRRQEMQAAGQAVTVVSTSSATPTPTPTPMAEAEAINNNCTRINIKATSPATPTKPFTNAGDLKSPTFTTAIESALSSPEKKTAFHELLISELAAMRAKSMSMEELHTSSSHGHALFASNEIVTTTNKVTTSVATSQKVLTPTRQRCNSVEDHDPDNEDVDADNIDDADDDGEDGDDVHKAHKVNESESPRKRCPSGCSSDSSPYGTERSARIRTSDWIEVGDNGKQVTLTSCHISLEDSGMEDEERLDDVSSGVGDSWDSVKEAKRDEKRSRSVKRAMSIRDLPPLPKSLSGINKILGSDSGLFSDEADLPTESIDNHNDDVNNDKLECQKDNDNYNNTNNNNNNNKCNANNSNDKQKNSSELNGNDNDDNENQLKTITTTTTAAVTPTTSDNLAEIIEDATRQKTTTAATATTTIAGCTLDAQLATLKQEMYGLRKLDLSLLQQLWTLNNSIQEFRTMLQDEQDQDPESYSQHSPSPSSYEEDSVSSEGEENDIRGKTTYINNANNISKNNNINSNGNDSSIAVSVGTKPKIITEQPKLANSHTIDGSDSGGSPQHSVPMRVKTTTTRPALPKPVDGKPVPRMRSAPPPPPTHRKAAAPPRPT